MSTTRCQAPTFHATVMMPARMLSLRQCCHSDSDVPGKWNVPPNRQCNTSDRWAKRGQSKDSSLRVTCQAGTKKNRAGGRVIFSPQVCAGEHGATCEPKTCTCGTKWQMETLRTNRRKCTSLLHSSRICDLQQIAFVSSHKFSPPLRIDGKGSLPFSTGKIEAQLVPVWPRQPCHHQQPVPVCSPQSCRRQELIE